MITALLIIATLVTFNAAVATWLLVRYHREQRQASFCNAVRYADEQSFDAVVDSALRVVS